ncbi:hypothetical protein LG201_04105 [Methylobacillus gramineus]|uniref:hypothetical protein n=1 Tax=Methylobacillus gramineus TaxID=755169 RepID=UPI001CFF9469|nr:hypothetical protein [Methylobacillus gramineus]MCB5184383.1 hypothetical protein [Methylobacillus gramineus]
MDSCTALLALWASTDLQATGVPAPDPLQGDGRVLDFYHWKQEIPSQPGKWLRSEPLEATLGLAHAQQQYRVLFSSTDGVEGKAPIVVPVLYLSPKGKLPRAAGRWCPGGMALLAGLISAPTPGMHALIVMCVTSITGCRKGLPWRHRITRA